MIRITDAQRRARLTARHHLGRTAEDVLAAVRAVVALHSTDPATPYLSVRARTAGFATSDLDRALLSDRSLWRLHAMRRTLFVVPAEDGVVVNAAAGRDSARAERRRLDGWLAAEMDRRRVPGFLSGLEARVLERLAGGQELRTSELTAAIPELGTEITLGSGRWATRSSVASRLLLLMAMEGRLVRTRPAGSWRSSQYRWAATEGWFEAMPSPMDSATARAELAGRYLRAFGPATLDDVRWWTGWTVRQAGAAIAAVGASPVRLDDGTEGLVPGDDLEPDRGRGQPTVALLPALDPTPMGWKRRDWFLGPHAESLFDRNGNIGPTVWVDGRIVGGWAQRPDGPVVHRLLEDIGLEGERRVAEEAAALTAWFAGTVVLPRFRTPLERELSAP